MRGVVMGAILVIAGCVSEPIEEDTRSIRDMVTALPPEQRANLNRHLWNRFWRGVLDQPDGAAIDVTCWKDGKAQTESISEGEIARELENDLFLRSIDDAIDGAYKSHLIKRIGQGETNCTSKLTLWFAAKKKNAEQLVSSRSGADDVNDMLVEYMLKGVIVGGVLAGVAPELLPALCLLDVESYCDAFSPITPTLPSPTSPPIEPDAP